VQGEREGKRKVREDGKERVCNGEKQEQERWKTERVKASVEAYINLTSLVSYLSFSRPCDSE